MTLERLDCGFLPLVDCAPLVVARELGFAEEENIDLTLLRQPSWSAIRDKLAFGQLDAAHMLSPLPIAMSMGLGGVPQRIDVLMVLSVNGNTIGVSPELAGRMHDIGIERTGTLAASVGACLVAATRERLRIGVPFPFSMHAELLYYWLNSMGVDAPGALDVRTVPPPHMAAAIGDGEIDAFCVGEPWGSIAVDAGHAEIILPGSAIWQFAPEKVLAVRHEWAEEQPDLAMRLTRAVWRAARWLNNSENEMTASDLLARTEYLDLGSEIIDRALTGQLVFAPTGRSHKVEDFIEFHDRAANFPWRSQAIWIATRWAARTGIARDDAIERARACFRADIYRAALSPIGADLPGASEKVEGALDHRTAVSSSTGEMFLGPDRFFDGLAFDPVPQDSEI